MRDATSSRISVAVINTLLSAVGNAFSAVVVASIVEGDVDKPCPKGNDTIPISSISSLHPSLQ